MQEIKGNLFDHIGTANAVCITTNGFIKNNGECVMGRGCAKEATRKWPYIASKLGKLIMLRGNIPNPLIHEGFTWIYSFPVKPISEIFNGNNAVSHMKTRFRIGQTVPGWACLADPELIKQSAINIAKIADNLHWTKVVIPRPGCGAGELNWSDIRVILNQYLDDRFASITF